MPKAYWINAYRHIRDPERLAAYAKLAGPAVETAGGRFLVRGGEVTAFEDGIEERTTLVEFDSYDQALAARRSPAYRRALDALGDGVSRDTRVVEGVAAPAPAGGTDASTSAGGADGSPSDGETEAVVGSAIASVDPPAADVVEDVRLAVHRHFARTGRAPGIADLTAATGAGAPVVRQALAVLHDSHDLVLGADRDDIVMAHPFASIPLGFSVMGPRTLYWGGCAWDSFALPHLLPGGPLLVATRCPFCDTPHSWNVGADAPPAGDQVAHFLTPAARVWDDVVHACGHQRIFCDESCVEDWLAREDRPRGYVMDLATLWRLAAGWYSGRLDRGYRRRDPASATAYFAEVGLTGPFWGLPDTT